MREVDYLDSNSINDLRIRYGYDKGGLKLSLLKGDNKVLLENQNSIEIYPKTVLYSSNGIEWILINHQGEEFLKRRFDFSTIPLLMGDDRYILQKKQKFGLSDLQGNQIIPYQFDSILDWNDSYISLVNKGKACLYDRDGNLLLPGRYDNIHILGEDLFEVERRDRRSLYHKDLGFITPYDSFYFTLFHNGIAGYHLGDGEWGLIDATGRRVIVPDLEELEYLDHGIFVFRFQEDHWGVIDDRQKVIFPPQYSWISSLGGGYLTLTKNSRISMVDIQGKQILPFNFIQILSLDSKNFLCRDEEGYQFYDEQGDLMFRERFSYASPFLNGIAQVFREEGSYLINEDGHLLFAGELQKHPIPILG